MLSKGNKLQKLEGHCWSEKLEYIDICNYTKPYFPFKSLPYKVFV